MKKRKVLITMDDDLYKRVGKLAEKCHRSRPDQFRHLLLTHKDVVETFFSVEEARKKFRHMLLTHPDMETKNGKTSE